MSIVKLVGISLYSVSGGYCIYNKYYRNPVASQNPTVFDMTKTFFIGGLYLPVQIIQPAVNAVTIPMIKAVVYVGDKLFIPSVREIHREIGSINKKE